jgi:uncharacterized protein
MGRAVTIGRQGGSAVCERCALADTPLRRLRGLLGRKGLESGEGILLRPAPAIHTWFMRFPIDAVFVARDLTVLKIAPDLPPWRMARCKGARAVLELPAGEAHARRLGPGERLEISDVQA